MRLHGGLLWELVSPWMPANSLVAINRELYAELMPSKRRECSRALRARVLRNLIRADYPVPLLEWLPVRRPRAPKKRVVRGCVYAGEEEWLLDYARASAAHKCAAVLLDRGVGLGKGPKTRGGRQGKWRTWM